MRHTGRWGSVCRYAKSFGGSMNKRVGILGFASAALLLVGACQIDSADRPVADRALDEARKPKLMLAFFGVVPGMKLLDMTAGAGWYTELQARVVGPAGEVYTQNAPAYFARVGDKAIVARLANNRLPNVKRWDMPLEAMNLPPAYFDGVIINDNFHDLFWLTPDVDNIVRQIYAALKPHGFFAVVDHSAPPGTGEAFAREAKGPHRIDEEVVKAKARAAGFVLEAQSDALRNPDDDRTKAFFSPEMKGKHTDKFALLFRKPR
jgi:predicted methyltransferase